MNCIWVMFDSRKCLKSSHHQKPLTHSEKDFFSTEPIKLDSIKVSCAVVRYTKP